MITSVGKFLRKLRIDNNEILMDMADKLNVSASFLSAVENGNKKVPTGWDKKICNLYNLDDNQAESFAQAIAETENNFEINFSGVKTQNRQVAVSFARKFAEMDDEQLKAIKKILRGK